MAVYICAHGKNGFMAVTEAIHVDLSTLMKIYALRATSQIITKELKLSVSQRKYSNPEHD
jgi:hypothetical protein